MPNIKKIILKSGKDQSLRRLHPWVFSGAIKKMEGNPGDGDLVQVFDNKGEFLALGHYQIGSIAVRIFSFTDILPDEKYWTEKIRSAYQCRLHMGLAESSSTNVFRLVNGEGDGMPGLIADFYKGTLVLQFHSIGMYRMKETLYNSFSNVLGNSLIAVYDKSKGTLPGKLRDQTENVWMAGNEADVKVREYNNQFLVNVEKGQKTGFFIDQRENRKLLGKLAKGRKVLNMFGYSGGFSVYALRGEAEMVHTVDSSASAIDLARENVELNFPGSTKHEAIAADAFEFLENAGNKYDLIVLDPPAFAKRRNVLHQALQGYKRLNAKALQSIQKGGILFTFSCSQVVSRENFRKSVFVAAANTGRSVRILYQLSQPLDHPVNIYHPEGEYLKGLVLYVE